MVARVGWAADVRCCEWRKVGRRGQCVSAACRCHSHFALITAPIYDFDSRFCFAASGRVLCKLRARCFLSFSGCLPEAAFSAFRLRSSPPKLLPPSLDPHLRFFVAYTRRRSSKGLPPSPMCAGRLRAYSRLRCPVMLCPLKMSRLHRHCLIHRRIATPTLMLPLPCLPI